MIRTAHLADDQKPLTTLCGLPWEDWQDPDVPSSEGFDDLPYGVKVLVREADRAHEPQPGDTIRQCPACFKAAMKGAPTPYPQRDEGERRIYYSGEEFLASLEDDPNPPQPEREGAVGWFQGPDGDDPPQPVGEDTREWTLRWDHRQQKHYIDGFTGGYETEGITVVPKSFLTAAERRADQLAEEVDERVNERDDARAEREQAQARADSLEAALRTIDLEAATGSEAKEVARQALSNHLKAP